MAWLALSASQSERTKNPKTGKLYTLKDLNVFRMADPKAVSYTHLTLPTILLV